MTKHLSKPILYESSTADTKTQGIGKLTDVTRLVVTNEINSIPTLEMDYLINGDIANEIQKDRIIMTDAGDNYLRQLFRINSVTRKPFSQLISVKATHVIGDLWFNTLKENIQEEAVTPVAAFNLLKNQLEDPIPQLNMISSIQTQTKLDWTIDRVDNAQKALGGVQGSLLQMFKAEYLFDNWDIHYEQHIGQKTNRIIKYGKDLKQAEQEEVIDDTYTAIKPWAKYTPEGSDDEQMITLPERVVKSDYVDKFEHLRVQTVDFSQDNVKSEDDLRNKTISFIKANKVGIPKVSLEFEIENIPDELGFIETLNLGDHVTVIFKEYGINTNSQVIKTEWDGILNRYQLVAIGEKSYTTSDYQQETVDKVTDVENKVDNVESNVDEKLDDFKEETDEKISSQEERVKKEVEKVQKKIDDAQKSISDVVNKNSNGPITLYGEDGQPLKGVGRISKLEWSKGVLNASGFSWDDKVIADNTGRFYATDIYGNTITGLKIFAGEMDGAKITGRVYIAAGPPNSAAVMSDKGFTFQDTQKISENGANFTSVTTDSLTSKGGLDVKEYTWLRNGLTVINGIDCRGNLYVTGSYPGKNATLRAADTKISVGDTFNQQAMVIDYLTTQVGDLRTKVSSYETRIAKLEKLVAELTA